MNTKQRTILMAFTVALTATFVNAQTTNFTGTSLLNSGHWNNGLPTLTKTGTIAKDGNFNDHVINWVVNQTSGVLTFTGNRDIGGDSVWDISGGSLSGAGRGLYIKDNSIVNLSGTGSILSGDFRLIGTGSTINQTGGSFTASSQLLGTGVGSQYNISNGGLSVNTWSASGTALNAGGGTIAFTNQNVSHTLQRITISGNAAISINAASAIPESLFVLGGNNNWHSAATGASLTVTGWNASNFQSLFNSGRFQYNGGNLNSTQFAETFQVSGSTLTVIPEPGTLALIGIALTALLLFRRRS